jgi:hypothetical protein
VGVGQILAKFIAVPGSQYVLVINVPIPRECTRYGKILIETGLGKSAIVIPGILLAPCGPLL